MPSWHRRSVCVCAELLIAGYFGKTGMMHHFRDFFRRQRVNRHIAQCGPHYNYHGVSVNVPLSAGLGACNALLRGKYEHDEAVMIIKHMPADLPVIELGGSLGVVSALIRSRLAAGVRHIVVEANPDVIDICEKNAASGANDGSAEMVHAAVYYDGPSARFHLGRDVHSNALGEVEATGREIDVSAVSLGALYQHIGVPDRFTLVCDIEGGEYAIFEHDSAVLKKAGTVILELHPRFYKAMGGSESKILKSLEEAGLELVERSANVIVYSRPQQVHQKKLYPSTSKSL